MQYLQGTGSCKRAVVSLVLSERARDLKERVWYRFYYGKGLV